MPTSTKTDAPVPPSKGTKNKARDSDSSGFNSPTGAQTGSNKSIKKAKTTQIQQSKIANEEVVMNPLNKKVIKQVKTLTQQQMEQ